MNVPFFTRPTAIVSMLFTLALTFTSTLHFNLTAKEINFKSPQEYYSLPAIKDKCATTFNEAKANYCFIADFKDREDVYSKKKIFRYYGYIQLPESKFPKVEDIIDAYSNFSSWPAYLDSGIKKSGVNHKLTPAKFYLSQLVDYDQTMDEGVTHYTVYDSLKPEGGRLGGGKYERIVAVVDYKKIEAIENAQSAIYGLPVFSIALQSRYKFSSEETNTFNSFGVSEANNIKETSGLDHHSGVIHVTRKEINGEYFWQVYLINDMAVSYADFLVGFVKEGVMKNTTTIFEAIVLGMFDL